MKLRPPRKLRGTAPGTGAVHRFSLGLDADIYVAHTIRRSKVTGANRNAYSEGTAAGTWDRLSLGQFGWQSHIHLIQPDIPRDQPDV